MGASDTGERDRGRGEEEPGRVRESRGGRGVVPGHPDEEGGGRQAGELVAWRGGARARRAHSPPSVEDEDDRGGRRAGPPAGWAGQLLLGCTGRSPRYASPSFIYFCFLISDICFDLNKILNHFITLCQFLQELDILFQSSFIIGIIFGHILIYITNIFPMQIFMH